MVISKYTYVFISLEIALFKIFIKNVFDNFSFIDKLDFIIIKKIYLIN